MVALPTLRHYGRSMSAVVRESNRIRAVIVALSVLVIALVALVLGLVPEKPPADGPSPLATLNAALNALAGTLLVLGFGFIRRGHIVAHRASMVAAFGASTLFLVTYLIHHARVGSVPYQGDGFIRVVYFSVLIPHIVLAAAVVPLALLSIFRGFTGRLAAHRRIARVTLPIWLYVSLSGVVLYWMLY